MCGIGVYYVYVYEKGDRDREMHYAYIEYISTSLVDKRLSRQHSTSYTNYLEPSVTYLG